MTPLLVRDQVMASLWDRIPQLAEVAARSCLIRLSSQIRCLLMGGPLGVGALVV